jgi:hypothetical protein
VKIESKTSVDIVLTLSEEQYDVLTRILKCVHEDPEWRTDCRQVAKQITDLVKP